MVAVARPLLATQLAIMEQHRATLLAEAEATAVHETRKAIRRTFTGFKLFEPFFVPGTLAPYRRRFKKMMRHLGRARDATVFRQKLAVYAAESGENFDCLIDYWQGEQTRLDEVLRAYMGKPKREIFRQEYGRFVHTPGLYENPYTELSESAQAAFHFPLLLRQRIAAVRAYAGQLDNAPLARLHKLRIQGKELRYALQFFAPLLGPEVESVLASLKQMQEHLGDLQDSTVALQLLAEMTGCETAVAHYRAVKEEEITQLVATFPPIWNEVNNAKWQQNLTAAIEGL